MDVRTIKSVDIEAARKVTADTMPACALIPEGILHTTSSVLDPVLSLVGTSKQLSWSPFSSTLQLRNISGSPNFTSEYPLSSRGCKKGR